MIEVFNKNVSSVFARTANPRFEQFFARELNIYNQAHLTQKHINAQALDFNQKTGELGIAFNLEGDLEGFILCLIKIDGIQDLRPIQSLFTESMNILLGKFLTDLEDETNLMALITHPRLVTKQHLDEIAKASLNKKSIRFETQYDLVTTIKELPCRILFCAHKRMDKREV